ncbi:MAG: sortase [Candidatus Saccharimonadales bacterium]
MQNDNPLFPHKPEEEQPAENSYVLPKKLPITIQPASGNEPSGVNPAADIIRTKLAQIYALEPDPVVEAREAETIKPRSKHQTFMHNLSTSGKSLAEIQTAWHSYYASLPDSEKHEVWQEFYEDYDNSKQARPSDAQPAPQPSAIQNQAPSSQGIVTSKHQLGTEIPAETRSLSQIHQMIRSSVTAGGKLKAKHHLQSLGFGMGIGLIVLAIFMFSFFNEVLIAPFIQPGSVGATPIIVDPSSVTASSAPQVIIPKISVDIPIDFSDTSTNESVIENDLQGGVVHYPTTVLPGQDGNTAYFGHSSNNIFNPGQYKFAFVLLHTLVPGDTFYIVYNQEVFIYKVFEKQIVSPSDVGVLGNIPNHIATATLITCDPPGTSINRLIVVGDQISPDSSTNVSGNNTSATLSESTQLPSNGPSLWSRLWSWL